MKKYSIENKFYWVAFIKAYIVAFVNTILLQYPSLGDKKKAAKIAFQYCKDLELPDEVKNDPEFNEVIMEVSNILGSDYGDFWNTQNLNIDIDELLSGGDVGVGVIPGELGGSEQDIDLDMGDFDEKSIVYEMIQKLLDDYNEASRRGDIERKNQIKNRIDELRELL